MVERGSEEEIIPYCIKNNIGFVAFSPIANGLLSGKINTNSDFSHSDNVRKFVTQLDKDNIVKNKPIVDL